VKKSESSLPLLSAWHPDDDDDNNDDDTGSVIESSVTIDDIKLSARWLVAGPHHVCVNKPPQMSKPSVTTSNFMKSSKLITKFIFSYK